MVFEPGMGLRGGLGNQNIFVISKQLDNYKALLTISRV